MDNGAAEPAAQPVLAELAVRAGPGEHEGPSRSAGGAIHVTPGTGDLTPG